MRINDIIQRRVRSGMSMSGAPVVRATRGTRVFSVEAQAASATRAYFRAAGCAGAEDLLQVSFDACSLGLSASGDPAGVSVPGATLVEAAGHESARAGSALWREPVASMAGVGLTGVGLAGVGLEGRRAVVVIDGLKRPATTTSLAALVADGRGGRPTAQRQDQRDQQDQFGTTGVGTDGYAFGTSANGTSPIDPRDFRTSSPPG